MVTFQDEQDVYILSKVSDIMHSLFGTHKEAILPVFDQLLPHFTKLIVSICPHILCGIINVSPTSARNLFVLFCM